MPNALLVYPEFPPSYWSAKYALEFIDRKAAMPPLGLLTIAAMFPAHFSLRVVDMNVQPLSDDDLKWADYVFLSAMIVQRRSFAEVALKAQGLRKKVIAGGPYPTSFRDEMENVDHLLCGEVEEFFGKFLAELESGKALPLYENRLDAGGRRARPKIEAVPMPRYDLIPLSEYGSMAVQFSRGCPFDCEFCDITRLFGRQTRAKSAPQLLNELEELYRLGWRGSVFFVDDNFVGNKAAALKLLTALAEWQRQRHYPFFFYTEASVNLAEMPDLMEAMVQAGLDMVFLGLETPNPQALSAVNKNQNTKAGRPDYLLWAVNEIQDHGIEVTAGFILGLDGDDESSFDAQINFVQQAGIPAAMVGILTVLKGTRLHERYQREGRLLSESNGNNVSVALNYRPQLAPATLVSGYKRVLSTLYQPTLRNYFRRCFTLIIRWRQRQHTRRELHISDLRPLWRSFRRQLLSRQGPAYLHFLIRVLISRPRMLGEAIRMAIMGYHYARVTAQQIAVDEFREMVLKEYGRLRSLLQFGFDYEAEKAIHTSFAAVRRGYQKLSADFRSSVDEAVQKFQEAMAQEIKRVQLPMRLEHSQGE